MTAPEREARPTTDQRTRAKQLARGIHERCWDPDWETFEDRLCANLVQAEGLRQRLEEAQWWHDLIVVDSGDDLAGHDCKISGWAECERIADLQRQLAEMEGK